MMGERVTLELDAETLAAARKAGVDLSRLLLEALRRRLPNLKPEELSRAADEWYKANKMAVDAYNERVARHGILSDEAGLL